MLFLFGFLLTLLGCQGICQENSKTQKFQSQLCSPPNDDEKAMLALEKSDFITARDLLITLIDKQPQQWFRYPRLARAYAGLASFDFLAAMNTSSTSDNALTAILPAIDPNDLKAYQTYIQAMEDAITTLEHIPSDYRNSTSDDAISAKFQLFLYRPAFSLMSMNLIQAQLKNTGSESLSESLTPESAGAILRNLRASLDDLKNQQAPISENSTATVEQIETVLDAIDTQPGDDYSEKIQNYLEKNPEFLSPSP